MNYLVTLSLLLSLGSAFAQSDFFGGSSIGGSSTLDSCRSRNAENFACGECETPLQDDFTELLGQLTGQPAGARWSDGFNGEAPIGTNFPDGTPITLEATLSRIKDMMKSNNPEGGNGLNYMVIGQSESLQDTSIRDGKMYPRIAIKSPNSELWVTFNTDPMSEAYQTLEVMRWNGKDAKYDFVELDFGKKDPANPAANRPAKFDGTGQKCIACHKEPDPRPNWETYRAWSGIVPSRDDMIEIDKKHGRPVTEGGEPVGMDGRAYLSFLEQVVDTKEGQNITPGADRRLALLDIPVDDKIQFRDRNPAVSSLSPRAQLDAIKAQASANDGFYRIPHFPYKGQGGAMSNFDSKTAQYAGPSQFAFDQMSGQNFCRISQRLIEDENYNKFKWIVAGISQCGAADNLEEWIPESYRAEIARYFSANPQVLFSDLASAGQLPPAGALGFSAVSDLLRRDTERNHERADEFKRDRHQRMGTSYLTAVEGGDPAQSATQAEFFASQFTAPERYGFHAIDDFGGVNGVTNSEVSEISGLRAVLEPMGIDPGKWSLMRGPNTATDYDSLAFSDQFVLLFSQRAIVKAMEDIRTDPAFSDPSAGGNRCEAMKIASNRDLSTIQPQPQENQMSGGTLAALCGGGTLGGLPDPQVVSPMIQVLRADMAPRAKELFGRCVRCHGANANATPFEGMEAMTTTTTPGVVGVQTTPWSDDAWERFNAFLATGMSYYGDGPMGVEMSARLRSHSMPSGGWQVPGETPAQKLANDNLRREELARYVELTFALSDNPAGLEQLCRSINSSLGVGGDPADATNPTNPTGRGTNR
jgi:hypothetical protein